MSSSIPYVQITYCNFARCCLAELGFSVFLEVGPITRHTSDSDALRVPPANANFLRVLVRLYLGTEVDIHFTLLGSGHDLEQNT
jgi:hypothetical protein